MDDCAKAAKTEGKPFTPFNLRDWTEKLNNNDSDVMDATLHSSERTMRINYDRRRTRVAKPTR